jgi:hypothetical protein
MVAKAIEEATAMVAAKQAAEAKAAEEAVAVTCLDYSSICGPSAAQIDTREAFNMTLDQKAAGKRPTPTIGTGGFRGPGPHRRGGAEGSTPPRGIGGSRPPPPPISAFTTPRGMPHIFCRFFLFSPHSFYKFSNTFFYTPAP